MLKIQKESADTREPAAQWSINPLISVIYGQIDDDSVRIAAAAKLGTPRQTLESKIRRLGINKHGLKRQSS